MPNPRRRPPAQFITLTDEEIKSLSDAIQYHSIQTFKHFGRYQNPWVQQLQDCRQELWYECMYHLSHPEFDRLKGTPTAWCVRWMDHWVKHWMTRQGWIMWRPTQERIHMVQLTSAFIWRRRNHKRVPLTAILTEAPHRPSNIKMQHCLHCGEELCSNRPKLYCNNKCKMKRWWHARKVQLVLAQSA